MEPKAGDVPTASEVVAGNEDLLTEILVRLPPKPLLRFKSVSKTWLRLISCPQFRRRSSQRLCKDVSGLLLMISDPRPKREYEFITLSENSGAESRRNSPLERLDFVEGQLKVKDHCNGLLLCERKGFNRHDYYVFNPTTKEYAAAISADQLLKFVEIDADLVDVSLAFDPRESLHYKLLLIYSCSRFELRLHIYSSDTGLMRQINEPFPASMFPYWGAYWHGAVNWFDDLYKGGVYFNVDEERFGKLPVLPHVHEDREDDMRWIEYYGESNDHLYLIHCYESSRFQFYVYEMDRGYSRWFMRFRFDLQSIFSSLPQSLRPLQFPNGSRRGCFNVTGVFRKDDDEESFLVFWIPGMMFRLKFEDESLTVIRKTKEHERHSYEDSIPFIESLYRP